MAMAQREFKKDKMNKLDTKTVTLSENNIDIEVILTF